MRFRAHIHHFHKQLPEGLVGGALLFGSTTIVNAGNYAFNLILGRWLGPAAFADLNLIVTLFLVITFVTVALQTTTAKFVAVYTAAGQLDGLAGLRRWLGRAAWLGGLGLLLLFGAGAPLWHKLFHTASAWPFVIFALGVPFYFALGIDRGVLQGQARFGTLAVSFQAEMWVRLLLAIGLVALGLSVPGATAGLALSLLLAWLVSRWSAGSVAPQSRLPVAEQARVMRFAGPVVAALAGQILINNSDVLLVKSFFSANEAGLYAALALIGRIVFFATWSVVTVIFPLVAQRHQRGLPHHQLLYAGLGIVAAISTPIVIAAFFTPVPIVELLFGSAYLAVAPLLGGYALATTLYALANVVISYRLSLDSSGGSMLALAAGLAQVLAITIWHHDLAQVVLVQIAVMAGLVVALLAWDGWLMLRRHRGRAVPITAPEPGTARG